MKQSFAGDLGILAFGPKILKKFPQSDLEFHLDQENPAATKEPDFWQPGIKQILNGTTRFGRIGIAYDRTNSIAKKWISQLETKDLPYHPTERPQRTEKIPRIFPLEFQLLKHFALEGLSDSVEFRRLARKYLRNLKHWQTDTVFFLEAIFAEESTRKIIQSLCGTQIKAVFVTDFFEPKPTQATETTRDIKIRGKFSDTVFVKKRAEQILRTKLPENVFE